MAPRFELHGIFASSPTYKVGLMLALCGEAFDYVHIDMMKGAHKSPEYISKNRFGVVPCLVDRSDGSQMTQSSVIAETIAEATGKFYGNSPNERRDAREWVLWGWDRLAKGIYRSRGIKLGFQKASPEVTEHYKSDGEAGLKALDGFLAGKHWICDGDQPTFADIDLFAVAVYAEQAGFSLADYPNVKTWIGRIEALPGYAGPNDLLPKESRAAA